MAVKGAKGKTGKLVVWMIVALLIVGLAGFGASNFGGSVSSIGSVGDTEIPVQTYARTLEQELRALRDRTGEEISLAEAQAIGLQNAVLARVVSQAALDDETDRLGLSVGDDEVRSEIVGIPAFQGMDGSFDREAYEFTLQQNNMSVPGFEARVRDESARRILRDAVTGGVVTPQTYVDTLYAFARETRDVAWIRLTPGDLEEPLPEPTEEELRVYYDEHPDPFTVPETRVLTYAWVTPEMLVDAIPVDEEELRALYDERRDQYVRPERRIVDRLVFSSEEAAQAAADAIAAGETDFEALLEERDLDLADVDMGEVTRADLGAAAETVFALDEPGISGPAPTPLGPALFRVNAVLSAQETPFEEVRDELRTGAARDRAQRTIDDMLGELNDRLAGGASLEQIAEETQLELGEVAMRPGADAPILDYQAFREAAAAAQEGDFPELIELADGGLVALRLDAIEPPRLQDFAEVRDQVVEAWRAEQTRQRLIARAEDIAAQLEGNATLSDLGYEPNVAEGVLRSGVVEGLPETAISTVFEMERGGARAVAAGGEALVLSLRDVTVPEGDSADAQQVKTQFARQTAQAISSDLLDAFTRAVEQDAGLSLDQSSINAVHSQFPG